MLQTHIPWLADGYRIRLQQQEKSKLDNVRPDGTDSFVLCPKDYVDSYAELKVTSGEDDVRLPKRRVQSAHSRLGGGRQTGQCDAEENPQSWGGDEGGLAGMVGGKENTEGTAVNSLWQAKKNRMTRPSSSGPRKFRFNLPPRPSSALAGDCKKRPSSALAVDNRPASALAGDFRNRPPSRSRPSTAMQFSRKEITPRDTFKTRQRPHSASAVHRSPTRADRVEAIRQAWAEDPRSGLHLGGFNGVGPSPFLMDRHARCLDQMKLANGQEDYEDSRCQSPCGADREGEYTHRGNMSRIQRYIDYHRPNSATGMRKELEGSYRRSFGYQGKSPHFCNFVHKADLHTRLDRANSRSSMGGDDDDRADSMLSEPTDNDILAQWRKHSRLTGTSGTEGRPGSPDSANGRNMANGNLNHTDGANSDEDTMSVSVIVQHLVNSEGESLIKAESMITLEDDRNVDEENEKPAYVTGSRTKDTSTMTTPRPSPRPRTARTRPPPVPKAKMIPTITIPSSPIPSADQQLPSHRSRSSGESSPRKSTREDPKPPDSAGDKSARRPASATRPPSREKETPEKGKRLPVSKKTKKSTQKRKKSQAASMEHAPTEVPASADVPAADGAAQPAANGLHVNVQVPDLPGLPPSGKEHGKHSRKGERRLITTPPGVGDQQRLPPDLLDLDSAPRSGYDFGDMESTATDNYNNKVRLQSWLNSRMALSQQASRFELPMDMKVLEKITMQEYLKKFCIVTSRRLNLYKKIFMKHKDKSNTINKQGLETCLRETLVQTLKENTYADLCDLLEINNDTVVDFDLFAGVAAITERILYPHYTTEDTLEKPEYQRERIETADFEALDWKLHGIKISDKMKKLLKTIE